MQILNDKGDFNLTDVHIFPLLSQHLDNNNFLWISCPIISDSIENLRTMSIMKDISWKTSKLATKDWLFLLKDLKTKDIIFVQLSIDFCSSSTPSTYRKVQQERPNFLDIMKDFSSLRKTLEFLLFLQNERQLRKTSWIGLLSLLLDDNFDITIKKEKSFERMHFFASFERL